MLQACFCGHVGEIEDQRVVYVGDGELALQCPQCGRFDRLNWLSESIRAGVFRIAAERQADVVRTEEAALSH